jgi:hypothetical protein
MREVGAAARFERVAFAAGARHGVPLVA